MVTTAKLQSAARAAAYMTTLRAIQAGQVSQSDLTEAVRTINAGQSPASGTVVSSSIARGLKDAARFAPLKRMSRLAGLDGFLDSLLRGVKQVTKELATTGTVTTTALTIPRSDTIVTRVIEDVLGVPTNQIVWFQHLPATTTVSDFLSPQTVSPPPVAPKVDYSAYGLTPEKEAILRAGYGLSPTDPLPQPIVDQLIAHAANVPPASTLPVSTAPPNKWILYGLFAVGAFILFTSFKDYKKAGRSPFVRGKARIRRRRRLPLR